MTRYTLEYKMQAVRLVKGGQVAAVTAKILGIPKQTLENWVRLHAKGQLKGAGDKPVRAEQMELARLRAELDSQQQKTVASISGLRHAGGEHQRLL